jgi:predicted nucleic acid-binding Zn ribbon protein
VHVVDQSHLALVRLAQPLVQRVHLVAGLRQRVLVPAHGAARAPRGVGSVLDSLVAGRGLKAPVAVGSVLSRWDDLVGPGISGHCRPESFDETVVRVRCDSTAYAANLRLMVPQLLRTFDEQLGEGIITRIEILGPAAPSWKRGRRSVRGRGPRDTYG